MNEREYAEVKTSVGTGYFKDAQMTCLYCSKVFYGATGFQIGLDAEFKEGICPHCGKKNVKCYYGLSNAKR